MRLGSVFLILNVIAESVFETKKGVKMGLLSAGEPLDWEDMVQWQDHVRKYGVQQFIRLYNRLKVKFVKMNWDGNRNCLKFSLGRVVHPPL